MIRRRGITLVELVMVIVLTALLAGLAIGGLNGAGKWREANAVRQVASDLTFARDRALLSGRRTLWELHAANQSYELREETTPAFNGPVEGSAIKNPATGKDWSTSLNDLAPGLRVVRIDGVGNDSVAFSRTGGLLSSSGLPIGSVVIAMSNGAVLTLLPTTGTPELQWE